MDNQIVKFCNLLVISLLYCLDANASITLDSLKNSIDELAKYFIQSNLVIAPGKKLI